MKKVFVIIAAFALLLAGCKEDGYKVTGTVTGLPDGTVLQLTPMGHSQEPAIAETSVKNGKFTFEGKVEQPLCVRLSVKDSYGAETFMLYNSPITIVAEIEAAEPAQDGTPIYEFKSFKVSGSELNKKLEAYKAQRDHLDELYQEKSEKHQATWEAYHAVRATKDAAKIKEFEASDAYKQANDAVNEFFQTVEETYTQIIEDNKDSWWGPMMAIYLYDYFTEENIEMFNSFSKEAQESYYGKKMKAELPGAAIGTIAESFTVKDEAGKEISLAELSKGKKYVLIDFWASWCNPCRQEIPNVKKQYAAYKDKGFEVVSISIDKKEDAWKKAVTDEQLAWPNFLDRTGVADLYGVSAIPAMFLIDASTREILACDNFARGEALAAKLAELLP